ncbi:hypothetical protein [Polynucleobacter sp. UK-Mo-2m-Kol15]|uniref:hypothetical protein n=1 Tax=Polynucleobacter sp. UK-Mo-2m-Kol15 TaxID=2576916 RepID=UPI001C0C7218|nr:hypothetical protein [Polynucleobacter sp. UK-Mo-2m-Kol15]
MYHQSMRTSAPAATTLIKTSSSGYYQAVTYPNKSTRSITVFALAGRTVKISRVLNSTSGEEIGQSTALERLSVHSEYKLWGKLINTINLTAQ